ncbi:MAG: 2TM domain-containing protein [Actinomycetales bacterium]|nr:2TM domain-containing protein [Actinomycetales bacterium]
MNEQDDDMTNGPVNPGPQDQLPDETELRALAIHNLRRREAFKTHLVVYLLVNAVFVGTWVMAGVVSGVWYPWWIYPMLGWGIGVGLHGWTVYRRDAYSENKIRAEMDRILGR